jgi:hypothetical protein
VVFGRDLGFLHERIFVESDQQKQSRSHGLLNKISKSKSIVGIQTELGSKKNMSVFETFDARAF